MAYFPNGASGDRYEEEWCQRCVHYGDGMSPDTYCPVWWLHRVTRLGASRKVLDHFIPDANGETQQCRMFVEQPNA